MRVSDVFELGMGQASLDFVNVRVDADTHLFVDPRALRLLQTEWGGECVSLIQNFFDRVLDGIREGNRDQTLNLLERLREPNETHLGLSTGRSRGHAIGQESAVRIYEALAQSEAIKTGLIQDLEETALMVEGVGFDLVSDIATNIIRGPLIAYTQQQSDLLGISLEAQDSGPMWDPNGQWFNNYQDLPRADGARLLLVPKVIVRALPQYNPSDYFNNYVLESLAQDEIANRTELVHLLKDRTPRVNKKDLRSKYGQGKRAATRITLQHNEILDAYRSSRGAVPPTPYSHDQLAATTEQDVGVDWDGLISAVDAIEPGNAGASAFHRAVQALLTAALYPWLTMPRREREIHDGRKRIDISYTNAARSGFFAWFAGHRPALNIAVECKNYSSDPENPELDQLAGRFGPNRGVLGLLVCRSFDDKELFLRRCRDTAYDDRGFIIALDDDDLRTMITARKAGDMEPINALLHERFEGLTA